MQDNVDTDDGSSTLVPLESVVVAGDGERARGIVEVDAEGRGYGDAAEGATGDRGREQIHAGRRGP